MPNSKKLLQAAAGSAGGEEQQIGVDFPGKGASTYLSTGVSSSGMTNGTTCTVSFWYFVGERSSEQSIIMQSNNRGLKIRVLGNYLRIDLINTSGQTKLRSAGKVPAGEYGWNHFLMSVNVSSPSTSFISLNDITYDPQWDSYTATSTIDFSEAMFIGNTYDSGNWDNYGFGGSLAYMYLDNTFRNLNTTSNRRLFIDSDLNPVTDFSSLSPIIYIPFTDEDTIANEGSGGTFTLSGSVRTTQFGVNNFPFAPKATKFDGSNDYLSSTDDVPNTTQFTLSFSLRKVDTDSGSVFATYDGSNYGILVNFDSSKITVDLKNSSNSILTEFTFPNYTQGDIKHYALCVDMSSQSLCRAFVNGEEVSLTFSTYYTFTSGTIANAGKDVWIGRYSSNYLKADIGELYYDNAYIDLSTNNIFWDSDNNKAKSIRKVLDETGNTPLIALPIDPTKPQLNLGTNSNFIANSFPVYGGEANFANVKRGYYGGQSPYGSLQSTDLGFSADSKKLTIIFSNRNRSPTTSGRGYLKFSDLSNSGNFLRLEQNQANGYPYFRSQNNGSNVLNYVAASTVAFQNNKWNTFMMSVDMSSTGRRWLYNNHESLPTTWSDYVNLDFKYSLFDSFVLFHQGTTSSISGPCTSDLSNIYITDDYINLSATQNRDYFVDGAGFPKDLTTYIEDGLIPTPKLYLKFDDPDNIGKNSGTGGDLTVSGNIETGFDVNAIS